MLIYIADTHPEKGMTYISSSGDEQFESYPELLMQARKYLQSLQEKGIQQGQVVILEIDQSQEFYRTFWACMLGGIIVAPVSPPAAWEPGSAGLEKFTKVWEVLGRPVVIVEEAYMPKYKQLAESPVFKGLMLISVNQLQAGQQMADLCPTSPDDIVLLQFSSGSTGNSQRCAVNQSQYYRQQYCMQDFLELKKEIMCLPGCRIRMIWGYLDSI